MAGKMRQFAAFLLSCTLCLGSAMATGPATETAPGDMSVEATVPGDVSLEIQTPADGVVADAPEDADAGDPYADLKLRIGLVYGNGALVAPRLLNADVSPVKGYRFGFYDDELNFVELARTDETAITMGKTTNLYLSGEELYDTVPSGSYQTLGCYHLQLPMAFTDYAQASEVASGVDGAFVAWVDGAYYVRRFSFTTYDEVKAAEEQDPSGSWKLCYTSVYGINVVKTGTTDILFQFDGGQTKHLGIMPGPEDHEQAVTWFKGYKYYGGFRYQRVDGGNITVVSIIPLNTYVKGVVPYESNKLWPLETLKAQAMCAKNYALINRNKHNGNGFDLCKTVDCQVYHGAGSGTAFPSELSDRAVDEIRGIYVWYDGKLVHTYFAASNGGGSEDVSKVWGSNQATYPYLLGVTDPYEAGVADVIPNYEYSNSFTAKQLTDILQTKGYATGTTVVDFMVTEYSPTGNVLTMKFIYANGKSNTFSSSQSSWLRTKLGCRSMHFTVMGAGDVLLQEECPVNGTQGGSISNFQGIYVLSGDGVLTQMWEQTPYLIAGDGQIVPAGQVTSIPQGTFVVKGTGNGHNVGYSQWGGYAMGKLGFTYDEILKFYFSGVEVGPKAE